MILIVSYTERLMWDFQTHKKDSRLQYTLWLCTRTELLPSQTLTWELNLQLPFQTFLIINTTPGKPWRGVWSDLLAISNNQSFQTACTPHTIIRKKCHVSPEYSRNSRERERSVATRQSQSRTRFSFLDECWGTINFPAFQPGHLPLLVYQRGLVQWTY